MSSVRSHTASDSAFLQLSTQVGKRWLAIERAAIAAIDKRRRFDVIVQDQRVASDDFSIVVFGSLARDEWTAQSDVDWTLLVDGGANADHLRVAQRISRALADADFTKPGTTGVFGNLAFSHEIVHQIGGQQDTNRNTTQRILLLLESASIGNESAYERVVRGVLNRYLEGDLSYVTVQRGPRVPRFLVNDVVRFWRTMAVDYASKHREREGEGWALRNTKLRLSRKLIFASGLLTCFNAVLKPSDRVQGTLFGSEQSFAPLVSDMYGYVMSTPLEILAQAWLDYAAPDRAVAMFDAYDEFLALLDDPDRRTHLKSLSETAAKTDSTFQDVRRIGRAFQEALTHLFFEAERLAPLTREFGVF